MMMGRMSIYRNHNNIEDGVGATGRIVYDLKLSGGIEINFLKILKALNMTFLSQGMASQVNSVN